MDLRGIRRICGFRLRNWQKRRRDWAPRSCGFSAGFDPGLSVEGMRSSGLKAGGHRVRCSLEGMIEIRT